MSRNFNRLYVVNLNLNFVSVTQPLTDHTFGTVNSVQRSARCNFNPWNMPYMMKSKSQFSFLPQSVSFTHAGSQMIAPKSVSFLRVYMYGFHQHAVKMYPNCWTLMDFVQ